jgi:hypothetical protein
MKTLTTKLFASALFASAATLALVATPVAYNRNTITASYAAPEASGTVTADYRAPESNSNDVTADYRAPESNSNDVTADYRAPENNNNVVVGSYAKPEAGFVVADIPGTDHTPSVG